MTSEFFPISLLYLSMNYQNVANFEDFLQLNIIQEQINGTGFQKKSPVQFCIYTHWGLAL